VWVKNDKIRKQKHGQQIKQKGGSVAVEIQSKDTQYQQKWCQNKVIIEYESQQRITCI